VVECALSRTHVSGRSDDGVFVKIRRGVRLAEVLLC
jgi:hypothetical protein